MNTNNYTIKSQEALQNAVQLAQSKGQQAIETGHLLKAVINVGENVTHFIFNKLGVNSHNLLSALDRIIDSYPRVSEKYTYRRIVTKRWRRRPVWRKTWVTSIFRWNTSYWDYWITGIRWLNC